MKLTKAQRDLMVELRSMDGCMTISDTYPPARKLVELGLAEMKRQLGGHLLIETDAGRAFPLEEK